MAARKKIKIAYCVAYDWNLLQYSLPRVYDLADEICLSIDINKKSWTGNYFYFDEAGFQELIGKIDHQNKIKIYYDDFSVPELSPMQNEVRQRNMMAAFLSNGNNYNDTWYLQLDADEYFLNFSAFCSELDSISMDRKVNVCCPFVILFKQLEGGFLFVKNRKFENQEMIPIATNFPNYEFGRKNGYFNLVTNCVVFHQSWARAESEIEQKLQNWGHNQDFDLNNYFQFWQQLNADNFKEVKNFHPFTPSSWETLGFLSAASIDDLLQQYTNNDFFEISEIKKKIKNSIWISRFKKVFKF